MDAAQGYGGREIGNGSDSPCASDRRGMEGEVRGLAGVAAIGAAKVLGNPASAIIPSLHAGVNSLLLLLAAPAPGRPMSFRT
jgi:hypothetical protein